jgi:N-acetyl-gamma-glutamyl-phosphate reductase
MASNANAIKTAILGASGYTGAELVRLLAHHPSAELRVLTANSHAGKEMAQVFPHLGRVPLPRLEKIEDVPLDGMDVVFCALPHGTTHEVVAALPERVKVVDLSPDFRLFDIPTYEAWYGAHKAPALQPGVVYGLTELMRDDVAGARIVANPGCYPTSAILPLAPLLAADQIDDGAIIIDSKSGVSGAGRAAKEANLYGEVAEGIHAYGIAAHRHAPEIEQELSRAAGHALTVTFTPHLMPMSRGILSTIYVRLANGATVADLRATLEARYAGEPFVGVLPEGAAPATRHVRGSNHCLMNVFADRGEGRAIIVSVIDNLVKGASGQAVQNMNLLFGVPETAGLEQEPLFP